MEKCSQSSCFYRKNNQCLLIKEAGNQAKIGGNNSAVTEKTVRGPFWPERKWFAYIKRVEQTAQETGCKLLETIRNELNTLTQNKQQNGTLIKNK